MSDKDKKTKIEPSTLTNFNKMQNALDKHARKKGENMGVYNYAIDKIKQVESAEDRLRLYREAKENIINHKLRYEVNQDWAEYKLEMLRSAIKRTERIIREETENDSPQIDSRPDKNIIHEYINKLAVKISGKGSSRYEKNTIEKCLKVFISDPTKPRRELIESLKSNISSNDYDRLSDEKLRGWENKLINKLKPFYPEYAQDLERTNNSN